MGRHAEHLVAEGVQAGKAAADAQGIAGSLGHLALPTTSARDPARAVSPPGCHAQASDVGSDKRSQDVEEH